MELTVGAIAQHSSISTKVCLERPVDQVLQCIASAGYPYLEIRADTSHLDPRLEPDLSRVERQLQRLDLRVHSLHAPFTGLDLSSPDSSLRRHSVRLVQESCRMCAALDGRIIVIHPGDNQAFPHQIPCQETRCHFLDSVQRLLGTAAHFQVHLAVENMIPTPHSCRFHTSPTTMITYLRTVATDRIGLCLDTGHASIGSKHLSLSAVIQVCNTHLIALHLHDTDGTCDRHWIPGQGLVSWPRFFSALFTAGYSGKYTLEVEAPPGLSQADLTRYLIAARTELLEQLAAPSPPASRDVRFGPVPV